MRSLAVAIRQTRAAYALHRLYCAPSMSPRGVHGLFGLEVRGRGDGTARRYVLGSAVSWETPRTHETLGAMEVPTDGEQIAQHNRPRGRRELEVSFRTALDVWL